MRYWSLDFRKKTIALKDYYLFPKSISSPPGNLQIKMSAQNLDNLNLFHNLRNINMKMLNSSNSFTNLGYDIWSLSKVGTQLWKKKAKHRNYTSTIIRDSKVLTPMREHSRDPWFTNIQVPQFRTLLFGINEYDNSWCLQKGICVSYKCNRFEYALIITVVEEIKLYRFTTKTLPVLHTWVNEYETQCCKSRLNSMLSC